MHYTPDDPPAHDDQADKIDNVHDELSSSLYIIYQDDYSESPIPKEYRDPWLQRVVDLSSFVDALQNKHRTLRNRWSEEDSERVSQAFEQAVNLGQEIENERRQHWLGRLSGRLFRGPNPVRGKSISQDVAVHPIIAMPEPRQSTPQSLPIRQRRLRRTRGVRELSIASQSIHTLDSDRASSSASGSMQHRRVVSEPLPHIASPVPRQPFFNAFLSDVAGDVSSSIRISGHSERTSLARSPGSPKGLERPRGASNRYHSSMPPFSSPSNLSTSSSELSSCPPTPPPKHSTPHSKYPSSKGPAYYSPLDLLRHHPQSEFGGSQGLKTPIQALQARLPTHETPTVRSTGSLRAQHVTSLPRRQPSCTATPVIASEPSSTADDCTCEQLSCTDDIAFSPYRPRLMNGAGYFHVKLVSEDQGDGCTVETWKIYACDRCNRQSRPPATRVTSIMSGTTTSVCSSPSDDYEAYITADEGFDEHDAS